MLLQIILIGIGIGIGFLIARLARDELVEGRPYFKILIIVCIIGVIGSWIYGKSVWAWMFGFIEIVTLVSFVKSYDRKFVRKRLDHPIGKHKN